MKTLFIIFTFLLITSSIATGQIDEVEIHGFASTGYLKSEHNNYLGPAKDGCFEFNEFGINFNSEMSDNIRIGMQIYSYDLGDVGNNNVKLDWAFLDYQYKEYLGLKVGKFKSPIGLYSEIQDYDMMWTSILPPQSIYNKYTRETMISTQGVLTYGNIMLNSLGNLRFDLFTGTQEIDKEGSVVKFMGANGITFNKAHFDEFHGCRLKWDTPVNGLVLAGTGTTMKLVFTGTTPMPPPVSTIIDVDMDISNLTWLIGSIEYTLNDFIFSAEYNTKDMKADIKTTTGVFLSNIDRVTESYYTQLTYRVNSWLETGVYYSVEFPDKKFRDGSNLLPGYEFYGWQKDAAISLRFNITDFWTIKLEEHFINGTYLAEADNPPSVAAATLTGTTPGSKEKNWTMFALKTTFSF